MNVLKAMNKTINLASTLHNLPSHGGPISYKHLYDMATKMQRFSSYGKQCRWLGYAQGVVVAMSPDPMMTLERMKEINKSCKEDKGG